MADESVADDGLIGGAGDALQEEPGSSLTCLDLHYVQGPMKRTLVDDMDATDCRVHQRWGYWSPKEESNG